MAGNKLCPQDYCNMIKRFIDERSGCFFVIKRKFTESEVYNYCINHTEILDKGDDLLIKNIIRKTLNALERNGYLSLYSKHYLIKKEIDNACDILIYDEPPKMRKLNETIFKNLKQIDESTRYNGDGDSFTF